MNHNAWLHGLYVFDAVSTVFYNAFKKKNDPNKHYAEKPYDFKPDREKTEAEKAELKAAVKASRLNAKSKLVTMASGKKAVKITWD